MFEFPKQTNCEQNLLKGAFYEKLTPGRALKRLFAKQLSAIVWTNTLAPETVNLPTKDCVEEIEAIRIILKEDELSEDVLRSIDGLIAWPVFYSLVSGQRVKFVAAYKRPNEADSSKWVVENYLETDWRPLDVPKEPLPLALSLSGLYEAMLRRYIPFPARPEESLKSIFARIAAIRSLEASCAKLDAKMQREPQYNRKVELNSELRKLNAELEKLKQA